MVNRALLETTASCGQLPPGREERLQVLVVTGYALGWRTYADALMTATAQAPDMDAVHVRVTPPLWVRAVGARVPGVSRQPTGALDSHVRRVRAGRLALQRWLARSLQPSHFDVIHVTPQFLAPALLGRAGRTPVAVGVDATALQAKAQRNAISEAQALHRYGPLFAIERRVFDEATSLVCMSHWALSGLDERHRSKAVVVPPFVDAPTPSTRRREASTPVRILFVGNAWCRKGGDRLLRWHQHLFSSRAELHVCGSDHPDLTGRPGVVDHGTVERSRLLSEILPTMDVLVLPTRSDMSPWAVAEAVACGVPVLSSAIGGIEELVSHGETGFLVAVDDDEAFIDALRTFIDDEGTRASMRAAAQARADDLASAPPAAALLQHWRTLGAR